MSTVLLVDSVILHWARIVTMRPLDDTRTLEVVVQLEEIKSSQSRSFFFPLLLSIPATFLFPSLTHDPFILSPSSFFSGEKQRLGCRVKKKCRGIARCVASSTRNTSPVSVNFLKKETTKSEPNIQRNGCKCATYATRVPLFKSGLQSKRQSRKRIGGLNG